MENNIFKDKFWLRWAAANSQILGNTSEYVTQMIIIIIIIIFFFDTTDLTS